MRWIKRDAVPPLQDVEEEGEDNSSRALLESLLVMVGGDLKSSFDKLITKLVDNKAVSIFGADSYASIAESHGHAAFLGRRLAGIPGPYSEADAAFGKATAREQAQFLAKFVGDIESGKYTLDDGSYNDAAIRRRADMYVKRLVGTANEAWAQAQPDGMDITWTLGDADHCDDCVDLAAGSPYNEQNPLPTTPGSCETQCVANCQCELENADGDRGFPPASFNQLFDDEAA